MKPPILAVAALTCAAVSAQVPVGTRAPQFEIEASWNGGPRSFADFADKVVLIEFFGTR